MRDNLGIIFSENIELTELEFYCSIIKDDPDSNSSMIYIIEEFNYSDDIIKILKKYFNNINQSEFNEIINIQNSSDDGKVIFLGDLLEKSLMDTYNNAIDLKQETTEIIQLLIDENLDNEDGDIQ